MAKDRGQRVKKNIESVKSIIQRDIKQDRESFITPEYLKRALDALCAFTPDDNEDKKFLHKAIDVVFTKNFIVKYINKAYKFIFNKPDDYLNESKDVKTHVKYISKEIGKEVDTLMEDTKNKGKLVAANEQIKIINYLRTEVVPVLEKYYKKILFFKTEEVETTPELISTVVKKLEKTKRSKVKTLKKAGVQNDISKGSAGDYRDGESWLSSVANDFKMLTHYDKIFTIWDKIIKEIDRWS